MNLRIRQERVDDYKAVEALVEAAFKDMIHSDGTEHQLVARLRHSSSFIPKLSLVAELDGRLVGHILLTKIQIQEEDKSHPSLTLAPVSVHPDFHKQGIGSTLINKAHDIAKDLGYLSIVLLGHAEYYPRFGYKPTYKYGIQLPFEATPEHCMIVELVEDGLKNVKGMVVYDKAFFE